MIACFLYLSRPVCILKGGTKERRNEGWNEEMMKGMKEGRKEGREGRNE